MSDPLSTDHEFLLIGVIHYQNMTINRKTRQKGLNESDTLISSRPDGHYTAVAYRRGNTSWVEIDDSQKKPIPRSNNHKVVPRLLMYVRCKK